MQGGILNCWLPGSELGEGSSLGFARAHATHVLWSCGGGKGALWAQPCHDRQAAGVVVLGGFLNALSKKIKHHMKAT